MMSGAVYWGQIFIDIGGVQQFFADFYGAKFSSFNFYFQNAFKRLLSEGGLHVILIATSLHSCTSTILKYQILCIVISCILTFIAYYIFQGLAPLLYDCLKVATIFSWCHSRRIRGEFEEIFTQFEEMFSVNSHLREKCVNFGINYHSREKYVICIHSLLKSIKVHRRRKFYLFSKEIAIIQSIS